MRHEVYACLNNRAIYDRKISDHKPLLKNGILSWNVMMKCREKISANGSVSYNNAYGLTENDLEYQARIRKIVAVLNEIVVNNFLCPPQVIALQEAPVTPQDLAIVRKEFNKHPSLWPFFPCLKETNVVTEWGLMTLFNAKANFQYERLMSAYDTSSELATFNSRAQLSHIKGNTINKSYYLYNIHIPHQYHNQPQQVRELLNKLTYQQSLANIILIGDFNVDPTQLGYQQEYTYTARRNNIQLTVNPNACSNYYERVDAILG